MQVGECSPHYTRNRPAGLQWFKRTALLSILLVQPFHFLDEQFGAVIGLALNIVLLGALNAMLQRATLDAPRHGHGASRPSTEPAGASAETTSGGHLSLSATPGPAD